jgi:hypothetical protein
LANAFLPIFIDEAQAGFEDKGQIPPGTTQGKEGKKANAVIPPLRAA